MQSVWRVACVRIPRFPIGAVWSERARRQVSDAKRMDQQLSLLPLLPTLPASPAGGAAPSRLRSSRDTPAAAWDEQPVALVADGRLRAISTAAARARVRTGMTPTQARALCAALETIDWDDIAIEHGITTVTAALLGASPQVTPVEGEPGLWWIGAGCSRDGERELVRALLGAARAWHPRARVAVADSCVTARAATWSSGHGGSREHLAFIVPPGGDAAYLATAPLGLVPMDEELRATLSALGLRTVGAFAALAAEDVERRWGETGLASWRLARGEDERRPVLARVDGKRSVEAELATPSASTEPLLFLVRAALDRLVADLVADGRSAAIVALTLTLDDARGALPRSMSAGAHTVTREVRLPRPVARTSHLFEQCRALLERWPLSAPVSGVAVTVVATAPASGEQGDLLATAWRDPAAADAAFARLRAELGPDVVVRPVARDEQRPERAGAWQDIEGTHEAATAITLASSDVATGDARDLTLRLLETPDAIDVEWSAGLPCAIWWRGARLAIGRAEGPERLSGDWWKDDYRRDYWRCEGETGVGELLIFAEDAQWYVHGWYD